MKLYLLAASFIVTSLLQVTVAQPPTLSLTPVITTGLSSPMQLVHAGDGSNRIFIVQKAGTIMVFDKGYSLLGTFLTLTSNLTSSGEQGLLSMAFHPDYKNNGFFYIYYTNGIGSLELARYKVSADPNVADDQSGVILKTIPHPGAANHNGGELHFGNDGYLYLSTGDGGGAGDPPNNAQTTSSLLGKMLRFAVNTTDIPPYYTVPAGNPFGNEVYAYGLRNPFRWSFDRATYDMWIGDVGQDSFEEVSYCPYDSTRGVNYGWRCYEGNSGFNLSVGCAGPLTNYRFPVYTYPIPNPGAASVVAGPVYRGNTYIRMRGYHIGTDYFSAVFHMIKYDTLTHTASTTTQALSLTNISDIGETEDGELYAVSNGGNSVYRINSDGPIGYTFTGNGNWDIASNWSNNSIPPSSLPAGAEIIINPAEGGECILNVPQTVLAGAKLNVNTGKQFRINGNLTIQ